MQKTNDERFIDYLVRVSAENLCEGVLEEPRFFYDLFDLGASQLAVNSHPQAFINGEQFPVRITHMTAAVRPGFEDSPQTGLVESLIQAMGLRLIFHDQFYMTEDFAALPLWRNVVSSPSPPSERATSSYTLDRPIVLSQRDAIRAEVVLEDTPSAARVVSVAFTGTGLLSKRPYLFQGRVSLTDQVPTIIPIDDLRNDGTEPVALTDMTIHCSSTENDGTGAGDIRQCRVNFRHVGNGTQKDWVVASPTPGVPSQVPAILLGKTAGRCVVHRFPGDGVIWEPGDGFTAQAIALDTDANNLQLVVGLHGYLAVT